MIQPSDPDSGQRDRAAVLRANVSSMPPNVAEALAAVGGDIPVSVLDLDGGGFANIGTTGEIAVVRAELLRERGKAFFSSLGERVNTFGAVSGARFAIATACKEGGLDLEGRSDLKEVVVEALGQVPAEDLIAYLTNNTVVRIGLSRELRDAGLYEEVTQALPAIAPVLEGREQSGPSSIAGD